MTAPIDRVAESAHRLARLAMEPQPRRQLGRRALGQDLLARTEELRAWVTPDQGFPIRLHPATTHDDAVFLWQAVWEALEPVLGLVMSADVDSDRWLGRLRGRVGSLYEGLEPTIGLATALSCLDDDLEGAVHPPLQDLQTGCEAVVRAASSAVGVVTAASPAEASDAVVGFEDAIHRLKERYSEATAPQAPLSAPREEVIAFGLGASPPSLSAAPLEGHESLAAAFGRLDPFVPANYLPSPLMRRQPPGAISDPDQRRLIFAERQLRFIGMPTNPQSSHEVLAHLIHALRLVSQAHPALAHFAAVQTVQLGAAARQADPEAVLARITRFGVEDAPRIGQRARRAEERLVSGTDDPLELLTAYKSLAESAGRGFLRLLLDLHDLANGRGARHLVHDAPLSSIVEQTASLTPAVPLFGLLAGALATPWRNADAHEQAVIGLDGALEIRAGQDVVRVEPDEVESKLLRLHSLLAGVDVGMGTIVWLMRDGLRPPAPRATPTTVLDLARAFASLQGLGRVTQVGVGGGAALVVRTTRPWPEEQCIAFVSSFSAGALGPVARLCFESDDERIVVDVQGPG